MLSAGAAAIATTAVPLAAHAVGSPKDPYQCREYTDCGVNQAATARLTATPGQGEAAGVRLGGTYVLPSGSNAKVTLQGAKAIVTGTDEVGGKPWKVKGQFSGKRMLLDFTPKGGPADVLVTWNGIGLAFPDGTVWKKI